MTRRRLTLLAAAVLTAAALLPVLPPAAAAGAEPGSARVVPIQVTGDPAQRFNMVVLGDGYTEADLPRFRAHVDKHLNVLWSIEPFKSYRSYVNVYAVEIVSAESGVDCDPTLESPRRETPLDMGFWGGCNPNSVQRLLTVDRSAATFYADMVAGTNRGNRQILAIGNSDTYGGAGGRNATASGGNALSALISPHELGHSLGGLQDEYDYFFRGVPGGAWDGGEPDSAHHTLLTEQEMRSQQRKWWRWLGEPSEAGGAIGRFEGGIYSTHGIWRPSRHSLMKSLGYAFDQVARERMTQRIAAKVDLIQAATPSAEPVGADRVVWVEPMHPRTHELDVTWALDGAEVEGTGNRRGLDLRALDLEPGTHTLTATVVDPTDFVRDPAVRSSEALTRTRTWTVDTGVATPPAPTPVAFLASTPTGEPVSGGGTVYVETTHPVDRVLEVTWRVDGTEVANPGNDRDLDLGALGLASGRHALTATVSDPSAPEAGSHTLAWTVDATDPSASHEVSDPLLTVRRPGQPVHYLFNGPFTMGLKGSDDTAGFVVREFRVDGDGWHNYYGWPTDPDAPFRFTATGTNVDDLIYGNLGSGGLSLSPFAERTPGYGRHTVEYRATDPTGNVGGGGEFVATLLPAPPACTRTVTGRHRGPLVVTSGVTCLDGATVSGPVLVLSDASLVATGSTIRGPLLTSGAAAVELLSSTVRGGARVARGSAGVTIVGSTIAGPLVLTGNRTDLMPPVLAGSTVRGPVVCARNDPAPSDLQAPNTIEGPATGQCAGM